MILENIKTIRNILKFYWNIFGKFLYISNCDPKKTGTGYLEIGVKKIIISKIENSWIKINWQKLKLEYSKIGIRKIISNIRSFRIEMGKNRKCFFPTPIPN